MMLYQLGPGVLRVLLRDPAAASTLVDTSSVWLVVKIATLVVLAVYVLFALTVYVQTRRIAAWFREMKRGHFTTLALSHLIAAALGWLGALLIL